ncbi:hypothetical protein Enr17x_07800 [Gimesia fumaroli]|uniref:Uncharacterized protein n=1 Tax=Gimesia fumaroli TaxID=2527976 RepID=A0A518I6P0_9PLAN|nr:hypothetical protein Enr17x_07800 [Gimesia fumaroli]
MLYQVVRGTKLGLLLPNIQEKFVGVDLFILA